MKKILVISDNDLLNQLYLINFEIYIGAKVTIIKDINTAEKSLLDLQNFDLIISMAMLNEHDIGSKSSFTLKEMNSKIPLLVIGTPAVELSNAIIIQSSYNLQNLLRTIASSLGITAKERSEVAVPKYYPIAVTYLQYLTNTPCILYLQVKISKTQSDYIICAKNESNILNLATKLHSEGVVNLYVNSLDRLTIVNKISLAITFHIASTNGASVVDKSNAVSTGFSFAASQLIDNPEVVQEIITIAETCSKVMDNIVSEISDIKMLIDMLMRNQEGYIYTHSMLVAYVAKHIIKNVSWGGESHVERINFMVFFHDLYLVPIFNSHPELISEEDLIFDKSMSNEEKDIIIHHARLAGEQISKYKKCPPGVDVLIKQHHGMSNGIGFATDFSDSISPLSKLFIVSESFVDYYYKKKMNKEKMNLAECIEQLNLKYAKHTYRKIIDPLLTLRF